MARGQGEGALRRVGLAAGRQDPRHRLVLQPLPGVALVDARPDGQAGGGQRSAAGEGPVEAEVLAEPDVEEVEGADGRPEQPLGEGVPRRFDPARAPPVVVVLVVVAPVVPLTVVSLTVVASPSLVGR